MPLPRLKILLISDFHESSERIDQLAEYIRAHFITFDTVLYLGDFLSLTNPTEAEQQQGLRDIEDVLEQFSAKLNNGERILYIPGNHDPQPLFGSTQGPAVPAVTEHGVLLHNRLVKLCPKDETDGSSNSSRAPLVLHGFGGSSPGFQNGEIIWAGFPFETDGDLEKGFREKKGSIESLSVPVGKNLVVVPTTEKAAAGADVSVVLVTHQGPEHSSTGIYTKKEAPIYSGSSALFNAVRKSGNIVAHVHGHTHDAWGTCKIRQCTVVNPGSLKYGRCALVTLVSDGMKWSVTETELLSFI